MALIEVRHPDVEGTAFVPARSSCLRNGWVPVDSADLDGATDPVDPPQEPDTAPTDPPTDVVGTTKATPAEQSE